MRHSEEFNPVAECEFRGRLNSPTQRVGLFSQLN